MRRRRLVLGCLGLFALVLVGLVVWGGPVAQDLYNKGFFEKSEKRRYTGDSEANLRALHTAMMLYHDSEERFPEASGWMDAIAKRIKTADLEKGEEQKKLIRPDLRDVPGAHGYAMNDGASGKYKDDLPGPKTILLFESTQTGPNAHGDPTATALKGGVGITIAGTIVIASTP